MSNGIATSIASAIASLATTNPNAAGSLINTITHPKNGQAATTVLSLLGLLLANPESAAQIVTQMASVPGYASLNIGGSVSALIPLATPAARAANPAALPTAVGSIEDKLTAATNSGFTSKLGSLFG